MKPEDIKIKLETAYESFDSISIRLTVGTLAKVFVDMTEDEKHEFFKLAYGEMRKMYPERYKEALNAISAIEENRE